MYLPKLAPADSRVPSPDPWDLDADNLGLLTGEQEKKQNRRRKKRHWTLLAVNIFVLLLNIGALLMMSVPRPSTTAKDVHLPHSRTSIRSGLFPPFISQERELINT